MAPFLKNKTKNFWYIFTYSNTNRNKPENTFTIRISENSITHIIFLEMVYILSRLFSNMFLILTKTLFDQKLWDWYISVFSVGQSL